MAERLEVRVTPNASAERIVEEDNGADSIRYRVYVTTIPEGGKANKRMLKILAKHLGLAPSSLEIAQGKTSRDKIIAVTR